MPLQRPPNCQTLQPPVQRLSPPSGSGSAEDKSKSTRLLLQSTIDLLASSWRMVESLATPNAGLMNDSPWYPYKPTPSSPPLDVFVSQVLLHTRTDFLTLLLATNYVEAVAAKLPQLVWEQRTLIDLRRCHVRAGDNDDDNSDSASLASSVPTANLRNLRSAGA
ncbi:hypothetical protein AURDEDRAFT_165780 [Auricularia subglabra TFB-10046 SS5]|nr:hypothetical protein AURDEDRAFT_165780 [Auricularia subglabra TFB-10046 SS5]